VDSTNYPALWKATRAHADVGFAGKGKEQEQNYRTAEKLARRCVALHPDSAESHFVLAMAVGRVALKVGGKKKIELSKEIKAEAERTLALDPCHDGAMHVIARWHYELGNLSWVLKSFAKVLYGGVPPSGGNEEARRWLEKAIACDPRSPLHHLWLGKTLLELKETDLARKSLEECLRLPPVYWDDEANKREAERLLQKINKG
jgi:tetratricopeptide (TPR) repeat protein